MPTRLFRVIGPAQSLWARHVKALKDCRSNDDRCMLHRERGSILAFSTTYEKSDFSDTGRLVLPSEHTNAVGCVVERRF